MFGVGGGNEQMGFRHQSPGSSTVCSSTGSSVVNVPGVSDQWTWRPTATRPPRFEVAGRAQVLAGDHPVKPRQGVQEGARADVRFADDALTRGVGRGPAVPTRHRPPESTPAGASVRRLGREIDGHGGRRGGEHGEHRRLDHVACFRRSASRSSAGPMPRSPSQASRCCSEAPVRHDLSGDAIRTAMQSSIPPGLAEVATSACVRGWTWRPWMRSSSPPVGGSRSPGRTMWRAYDRLAEGQSSPPSAESTWRAVVEIPTRVRLGTMRSMSSSSANSISASPPVAMTMG